MRVHTEQITEGEDEIIVRYKQMNANIKNIIEYVSYQNPQILGNIDNEQHVLILNDIYYFESVDNIVFAYTNESTYQTKYTLAELETSLIPQHFFRCNKAMIVNIDRISTLQSIIGNRIDVTLDNEEHIIISRHYAKEFRETLSKKLS